MGLTIRDAQAADAEPIAGLLAQLGYPVEASAVRPRLDRLAIVGDRVELDRPASKISALVVDEAHRGRGVGRALVEEMEVEARARGCEVLFLTTAARRKAAHAFYERVGLEETGKRFAKELR
jgi:ribosomal protein S18 acetylase RimI-like enzyme